MRILMLGNSFTYYNDMPKMLGAHLGDEVLALTRGGAYLDEHLDPTSPMGSDTLNRLQNEKGNFQFPTGSSFSFKRKNRTKRR